MSISLSALNAATRFQKFTTARPIITSVFRQKRFSSLSQNCQNLPQKTCILAVKNSKNSQQIVTKNYSDVADTKSAENGSKEHIEKLVKNNKIVVFMKGVPAAPQCGFSNAVVQIFRMHGVDDYDAHNVLESDEIRQGVKNYSDWPTIPQVYFDGEFIGGCDILLQMHQGGDLVEELEKIGIKSTLPEKE